MLYKIIDEDAEENDDELLSNLFRRYSMIRTLALVDACRVVRFHMTTGQPADAVHKLRSMIKDETDNCTEKDGLAATAMFMETFKLGNTRSLSL